MFLKIEPTTTITVDNVVFDVSKMSAEVQQMVAYFDAWRQEEIDLTSRVLMTRGALRDLQNSLLETIQKERAEALKKAEALGIIPNNDAETPAA